MLRNFSRVQLSNGSCLAQRITSRSNSRPHVSSLLPSSASRYLCLSAKIRAIPASVAASSLVPKRYKSAKAMKTDTSEETLGDEPPLYDGKPAWWARWAYALVALDILFTGVSVDMVINKWTRLEEVKAPPASPGEEPQVSTEYVLRPLQQRLGLAAFQFAVGTAAAAYILASRDRTVWRIRIKRMALTPHAPPPRPLPNVTPLNVLVLETASGRTKRFKMDDCSLLPGRHLGELSLRIANIRGLFSVGLHPSARVLGISTADNPDVWISPRSRPGNETTDLAGRVQVPAQTLHPSRSLKGKIPKSMEDDVANINRRLEDGQSMEETSEQLSVETGRAAELRRLLGRVWLRRGGTIITYRDPQYAGWTEGPVVKKALSN